MKNIIYILAVFALCFGFKAQAQSFITEYNTKLNSLPKIHAQLLNNLINGAPSSLYVNNDNEPAIFQRPEHHYSKMMYINKQSDFGLLAKAYSNHLSNIEVINIEWNGTDVFDFSNSVLSQFSNLQYIYIRSYQNLSQQIIENNFQQLVAQINQGANEVEILYSVMEQPK